LNSESIKKRDLFEKVLKKNGIEFRRGNAGGGNQLRQPYLKKKKYNLKNFANTEKVHFFGYYIGNYPNLKLSKINKIVNIINNFEN
jgi:CDP-6-deoxy-D-xylo-4-hexulose-3-dehydrase